MAESPMDTSPGQGASQVDANNVESPPPPLCRDLKQERSPENDANPTGKTPENLNIRTTRSRSAEASREANRNLNVQVKKENLQDGPFLGTLARPCRGPQAESLAVLLQDGPGGLGSSRGQGVVFGGSGPPHHHHHHHHHQTPDTTGSPEMETRTSTPLSEHQSHAQKRPAEDGGQHHQGVSPEVGGAPPQQRPKRVRRMYTQEQVQVLEKTFQNNEYPTAQDRTMLSAITQLTTEKVKVWFQNRRSRERRRRQNQLHNQTTLKRLQGGPPNKVTPTPSAQPAPGPYPPYGMVGMRLPSPRGPQSMPSSSSGQQWVQVWSPSSSSTYTSSSCSTSPSLQQPTHLTDLNNNLNTNNNANNPNVFTGMGQSLRPLKMDGPALVKQGPLSSLYSQMTRSGSLPSAAAGSAPVSSGKTDPGGGSISSSKQTELEYTPLHPVPSWSQAWPMFQSQTNLNVNPSALKKVTPMGQTEGFCMDNGKWMDNQGNLNHLQTNTYPGMGGTAAGEGLSNAKSFQDHYSYAAMIPTGYLHPYGYPYYPNMYQGPQMGFYHQQPSAPTQMAPTAPTGSSGLNPYLRADSQVTPARAYHQGASQTVRMALQRKLDVTRRTYASHHQLTPSSATLKPLHQQGLAPTQGGLVLKRESGNANNDNDVLSDSSTLSSPERGGGSPVKPLATSSPNASQPPEACTGDLPFCMSEKLSSSELLNTMSAAHYMWPQPPPVSTSSSLSSMSHTFADNMDKNNNFMDIGGNHPNTTNGVNPLTPYPNVAGFYNTNDPYTPVSSASYAQSSAPSWGSGPFTYKFPDWPPVVTPDPMVSGTVGGDSSNKANFSCPFTVIEPMRMMPSSTSCNYKTTTSTCDAAYPMSPPAAPSPSSVSDVRTATTAHSDISSYGASDNEQDCREMAPPTSAPGGVTSATMGCDDPTCRQGDRSPPSSLCADIGMTAPDVYNISDAE